MKNWRKNMKNVASLTLDIIIKQKLLPQDKTTTSLKSSESGNSVGSLKTFNVFE